MASTRLSFMTLNLWGTDYWPRRREAVKQLLRKHRPDILCLQEFSKQAEQLLERVLQGRDHVNRRRDDFLGWRSEGNIYWNKKRLKLARRSDKEPNIGREEVAIDQQQWPTQMYRRLFWVRLKLIDAEHTIFVSTAQLTFKGSKADQGGLNPRKLEIDRIISELTSIPRHAKDKKPVEPAFFMGDVNDTSPIFDLYHAGFVDCFTGVGKPIPPTVPVFRKGGGIDALLKREPLRSLSSDCITANKLADPREAKVLKFRYRGVAPSDHWPVWAEYELI